MQTKKITSALISVFDKTGLEPLIQALVDNGVSLYSTGGTERFIREQGHEVNAVEDLTGYPSILGGRVKTLHPKVFGGILNRSDNPSDQDELKNFEIPVFDLVIVDLYPFEKTVAGNATESEIIEKIDIGGIALIRAAAKNFNDILCLSDKVDYESFLTLYKTSNGTTSLEDRKAFAVKAFHTSSHYDTAIFNHFNEKENHLKLSVSDSKTLRYGENPHQKGYFYGPLSELLDQVHGKEISYNNLLDIDAAVNLMSEFYEGAPAFGILKHNNACGFAVRETLKEAYQDALAGDPVSAFGGVLICNKAIDLSTATQIHDLFCEVVIAPEYETEALQLLKEKKNRILLIQKENKLAEQSLRTCLNGILVQDKDLKTDSERDLTTVTKKAPTAFEVQDLLFASKICKHTKSNTIVLAKNQQLLASGTGQTSRVDALHQAIHKAQNFGFDLQGAVMASDAFFPFPDCVEIANQKGVKAVIQPGGSIKDDLSIAYCDAHEMRMVFTGIRHFKH
ncbi:bifunctional phosphoribosylaminoimidazolecarboxamide formyltransferase/IMP cyclohydrolase [Flavobacteriaceae bacterium]|jgi:phosphoribosylaminoimidazolecarboxamide formyltransferase/IMP cyclohydrolase|nr:bifunctional phosphoribosylaminoimidazolecarboxamide formyltransferase/IMP cyclohydrolase [Flavobacteriaceae bacterium]MDA8877023.1 bifunctional phosphoribosylaminoimidazolecarboxamide formyltransferase/IMP cyclohydrolase [Flavobacteriaceae bacterium]MDA9037914.1 bifunctional phosphoribosylaminoimidazolecarboxamide formyltransferase/IMP cyclohydrolase [Flavobacteriaceae bacterium]MDA9851295.1 bifunctional phosphoribosylaminoimidazolecarboxamide formyltransferase/IMP cyclohydrolase [Flavobacte